MRTVCIVQARIGSKRLPGKVLLPLNGHTVIGEVLTRCQRISGISNVVCAIPDTVENDPLHAESCRYATVYRGDEDDVLDRYWSAARYHGAAVVMRITADCPLICPELCASVLNKRENYAADYASNILPRTFPQGLDCEVFTMDLLNKAIERGPDEHVTTWMRADNRVVRANVKSRWALEGRLTLDTEDDYKTICAYFGHAPYGGRMAA